MSQYSELSHVELEHLHRELMRRYEDWKGRGLSLDMSRGKPAGDQFDLISGMLDTLDSKSSLKSADGSDCRNYGDFDGIPECKALFCEMLGVSFDELFVCGNSSLSIMYDAIGKMILHGVRKGAAPWCRLDKVKFLCPSPGYDRHFAITERYGFELIPIEMTAEGPDMDQVERLVASDESIKGIWCVPKYSNPQGITYSDETVRRFARMKTAAKDFMIMWDNAYAVHDLYPGDRDQVLNILDECKKAGDPDRVMIFASTSKISYAGAGVAAFACSADNMQRMKKLMSIQTIGFDKINMLRHARYFGNLDGIMTHMDRQAQLLRPKFKTVLDAFERRLAGKGIAEWVNPKGGYFISLDVMDGCAKRVVGLCKSAGVVLTSAGATFPYGIDPRDRNIRVAPTYPTVPELEQAVALLCLCTELAAVEKLLLKK
ncbi:aminotransferase class I/II-fold pyridoxal phosphate-dependent enzyme [Marasmitruncus massiliensis]|uniref:aminotransferase class I/II-fold pyridoxal phosphate-dependent enzyme n=1 Tax=Marasmitruncus massiliensis TaxID=1944642 RepID=UPI000C7E7FFE|nr:aminotransferase class I/II-fold pyridoxal phosphate-dependent enzyme [Marasmitruncus massiliensis]